MHAQCDGLQSMHSARSATVGISRSPRSWQLERSAGEVVVFEVLTEQPIDVMILDKRDYKAWLRSDDCSCYEHAQDVIARRFTFEAPDNGKYRVVLINEDSPAARVAYSWGEWRK